MASRGINKVILIGYLGQEPDIRHIPNGGIVANITLATSDSWRDKHNGEVKEKTEWHRVVLFGKLAEVANEYLHKGSQVYIEGSLQTRKWQDQNGLERYITEIVVNINGTMQMLSSRQHNNASNIQQGVWGQQQKHNLQCNENNDNTTLTVRSDENTPITNNETTLDFDDDIPF